MSPAVFVERNGVLSPMLSSAYADEDDLQTLLEKFPELLLGDEREESSPRYLLITREAGVPDRVGASDRWSVDHLLVDSECVPTFVEVKRRRDTRIRREVVGQLLEYAANARRHWPADRLRNEFLGSAPEAARTLEAFLGPDGDSERFWRDVQTNLDAGRIRLIFVADEIPDELRTIVEFLNEQMTQTEVLAIEVRRYAGDGLTTLVTSIIGDTSKAKETKAAGGSARSIWSRADVMDAIGAGLGPDVRGEIERLLDWAESRGYGVRQGTGATAACMLVVPGQDRALFTFRADGSIVFDHVRYYLRNEPFGSEPARAQLIERLDGLKDGGPAIRDRNRISGFALNLSLTDLRTPSAMDRFKSLLNWVLGQVQTE